ncbi:MAG: hypothetical protein C4337_06535 [Armatimonadota bacterium]
MALIQTPIDFAGGNYYTRNVVAYDAESPFGSRMVPQQGLHTGMGWEVYPQGLYETLEWLHE